MTTPGIDAIPYSRRQAIAAGALRERHPDQALPELMRDARAVLLALREVEGAPPPTGEEFVLVDAGLTADQEIRARALEQAIVWMGDYYLGADTASLFRTADRIAAWVATGEDPADAEPTPPQAETGTAPTQA